MLLLKRCVSVCPGDEGPLPAAPLPLPPAPPLAPLLAPPPVRTVPGEDAGEGMGVVPGPVRGRDGAPDLTPGAEEGTEGPHPGGDVSGRGRTTETESERETETGIGDDTPHEDERDPVPARGRGAVRGEGGGAVEDTGGETAAAAVPLSLPAGSTTVPRLLTEEPSPQPPPSVTS